MPNGRTKEHTEHVQAAGHGWASRRAGGCSAAEATSLSPPRPVYRSSVLLGPHTPASHPSFWSFQSSLLFFRRRRCRRPADIGRKYGCEVRATAVGEINVCRVPPSPAPLFTSPFPSLSGRRGNGEASIVRGSPSSSLAPRALSQEWGSPSFSAFRFGGARASTATPTGLVGADSNANRAPRTQKSLSPMSVPRRMPDYLLRDGVCSFPLSVLMDQPLSYLLALLTPSHSVLPALPRRARVGGQGHAGVRRRHRGRGQRRCHAACPPHRPRLARLHALPPPLPHPPCDTISQ